MPACEQRLIFIHLNQDHYSFQLMTVPCPWPSPRFCFLIRFHFNCSFPFLWHRMNILSFSGLFPRISSISSHMWECMYNKWPYDILISRIILLYLLICIYMKCSYGTNIRVSRQFFAIPVFAQYMQIYIYSFFSARRTHITLLRPLISSSGSNIPWLRTFFIQTNHFHT